MNILITNFFFIYLKKTYIVYLHFYIIIIIMRFMRLYNTNIKELETNKNH